MSLDGEKVSLKEYVDMRFEAQEKAVMTALANVDKAYTRMLAVITITVSLAALAVYIFKGS